MIKKINIDDFLELYKQNYFDSENIENEKVLQDIQQDYESLIDLRNRIEYDIKDKNVFAEDGVVLDHILDLIETLFVCLGKGEYKEI